LLLRVAVPFWICRTNLSSTAGDLRRHRFEPGFWAVPHIARPLIKPDQGRLGLMVSPIAQALGRMLSLERKLDATARLVHR
jgi:hypothetical protein